MFIANQFIVNMKRVPSVKTYHLLAKSFKYSKSIRACFAWLIVMCIFILILGCYKDECIKTQPEKSFTNSIGMEMIYLSAGYYVSKFETRQSEFKQIMSYNPSRYVNPENPVENLTSKEAKQFCDKLTEIERSQGIIAEGYIYDLPKFDEWLEYAADAGMDKSITPLGSAEMKYEYPMPVGYGETNRFGIYDIRGNVSEYSCDLYNTGSNMILGAWWNEHRKDFLQIKNKAGFLNSDEKSPSVGFRCVLVKENR